MQRCALEQLGQGHRRLGARRARRSRGGQARRSSFVDGVGGDAGRSAMTLDLDDVAYLRPGWRPQTFHRAGARVVLVLLECPEAAAYEVRDRQRRRSRPMQEPRATFPRPCSPARTRCPVVAVRPLRRRGTPRTPAQVDFHRSNPPPIPPPPSRTTGRRRCPGRDGQLPGGGDLDQADGDGDRSVTRARRSRGNVPRTPGRRARQGGPARSS